MGSKKNPKPTPKSLAKRATKELSEKISFCFKKISEVFKQHKIKQKKSDT